jgi:para-aminobenzoate synthetase component I
MNAPARGGADAPVRLGLDFRPPETLLPLLDGEPFTLLLHGAGQGARGRFSRLFAFPDFTIQTRDGRAGLDAMRARLRPSGAPGFTGGYAGLMAYDLGAAVERVPDLPDALSDWPAVAMGWYCAQAVFDHAGRTAWVEGLPGPARRLHRALSGEPRSLGGFGVERPLSPVWPETRYLAAAARAREYVRAGDVFQVNLSHPFRARLTGDGAPAAVFARLAAQSPAAFAGYFRLDADRVVVTNSPERFVQVFDDGRVQTRPIKGTRPRGRDAAGDAALAAELKTSEKDRAENLMIVDLMRNDLARVCAPGSVTVPELFSVESFSNVHHLVSTVEGRLAEGRTALDLIEAAFPPGSITGAPKPRAMEIIAELEGERRGPYCGALGWIGADGAADLNVMIRTAAFVRDGAAWDVEARSGGAITIDSVPEAELAETRAKISALARAMEPGL